MRLNWHRGSLRRPSFDVVQCGNSASYYMLARWNQCSDWWIEYRFRQTKVTQESRPILRCRGCHPRLLPPRYDTFFYVISIYFPHFLMERRLQYQQELLRAAFQQISPASFDMSPWIPIMGSRQSGREPRAIDIGRRLTKRMPIIEIEDRLNGFDGRVGEWLRFRLLTMATVKHCRSTALRPSSPSNQTQTISLPYHSMRKSGMWLRCTAAGKP